MTSEDLISKISDLSDALVSFSPSWDSDEDQEEYIYSVNEALLDLEKVQDQLATP